MYCRFFVLFGIFVLLATGIFGCDRISSPVQSVVSDDDVVMLEYIPTVEYWNIYDQEALSVSWEPIAGADWYSVSLAEDHGGPVSTRDEVLWFTSTKGTQTVITKDAEYFNRHSGSDPKWFVIRVYPMTGQMPVTGADRWYPYDYRDKRLGTQRVFTPFFWYPPGQTVDGLRSYVEEYRHARQEFIFNEPRPLSMTLPLGDRYEVVALKGGEEVYRDVRHAIGTAGDTSYIEKSVYLPEGINPDELHIRIVWQLGVSGEVLAGDWVRVSVQDLQIKNLKSAIGDLLEEIEDLDDVPVPVETAVCPDKEADELLRELRLEIQYLLGEVSDDASDLEEEIGDLQDSLDDGDFDRLVRRVEGDLRDFEESVEYLMVEAVDFTDLFRREFSTLLSEGRSVSDILDSIDDLVAEEIRGLLDEVVRHGLDSITEVQDLVEDAEDIGGDTEDLRQEIEYLKEELGDLEEYGHKEVDIFMTQLGFLLEGE